jgi:GT2 family glycosyltransferase
VLIFLNNDTLTSGVWLPELAATLENGMALLAGVERRREPDLPAAFRRPAPQLLAGWCLALRRATFFELGGFDERFRLYFSDTDLQCRLLVQFGAEALLHVEELPVRHLGHRSTRRLTERSAIWRADRWQFLAKWNSQAAVLPADEEAGEP